VASRRLYHPLQDGGGGGYLATDAPGLSPCLRRNGMASKKRSHWHSIMCKQVDETHLAILGIPIAPIVLA